MPEYDLSERISEEQLSEQPLQFHKDQSFLFGFDLRSSPQEDVRQYLPFLEYLEEMTGYHFHIYFTPKNSRIIDELGKNNVQFASIGATSFIEAQIKYGVKPLVRGVNQQGKAEYQSVFITSPQSQITSLM